MKNKKLEKGNYYVYTHTRLDKNEIFYVGVGTRSKQDLKYNTYFRAYSNFKRNNIWKRIVLKNENKYQVDIVFESDNYLNVLDLEIQYVSKYGRIDLGTGILANLTNGGEGNNGRTRSKETIELQASKIRGRKHSQEAKNKISSKLKGRKGLPLSAEVKNKISQSLKGRKLSKKIKEKSAKSRWKEVFQYSKEGIFIKSWPNVFTAAEEIKISKNRLAAACRKNYSLSANFLWSYTKYKFLPPYLKYSKKLKFS